MFDSGISRPRARGKSKVTRLKTLPAQPVSGSRPVQRRTAPARTAGETRAQPRTTESRPLIVLLIMVLAAAGLVARLTFWQLMQHGPLTAKANAQYAGLYLQAPKRGQIYDASGLVLATNVVENEVYGYPRLIKQPLRTATILGPVLNVPATRLYGLFTTGATSLRLASNVSATVSRAITNLALPGIILGPETKRFYPQATLAAQLLGFVNGSNVGQYGLERYYDTYLSGHAGVRNMLRDTAGNTISIGSTAMPSQDGATLHLSLDSTVQNLVEIELQKAIKEHHADGGTIIVMDPHTGRLLALANDPSFNPNQYSRASDALYNDSAVQDQYEPGSTFKIITMAAGLDSHMITPQTSFDDTGRFVVTRDFTVRNWNLSGFGIETMTQVLQHSANVGASFVAHLLGTDRFYHYVRAFQFGKPTGVDLSAEASGSLPLPGSSAWTVDNLYTNSYGQGLAVTPMQMIRAVSAVANGGIMMKPQIVTSMEYRGSIEQRPPVSLGRVISAQTAHTLTGMLVQSAVGGEAAQALIKGYNIAAKTGTANIPGPGGYIKGATIASIVGYAPAFHPRFAALVIIRHPRDTLYGSIAAAPVMHDLFGELFMHYHIAPIANAVNK